VEKSYLFEYPRPWQSWVRTHHATPRHNLNEVFANIVVELVNHPDSEIPPEIFLKDHFIETFEEIFMEDLTEETVEKEDQKYVADLIMSFESIKEELYSRRGNFLRDSVAAVLRHSQQFLKSDGHRVHVGDIQLTRFTLVDTHLTGRKVS